MQVGLPANTKDYQSNILVNKLSNNELKPPFSPPDQNSLHSSHDNGSNESSTLTTSTRNGPQRPNQFNKSSSLGNLSFINIVGLPYHPRQSSVPSTLRNQVGSDGTIFPIHYRNASESNAVPPRPPRPNTLNNVEGTHVKATSLTSAKSHVLPTSSGGTSSDARLINQTNFRYVNGGTQQNPTEPNWNRNNGTTINQTGENVSNINVNFYRAVPMNVISSVPTIKCLNTHSAKNVSNVQIMPLSGTSIDQNASSTPCNNTTITSSQVTVHNEPSIQTNETVSSVYLSNRAVPQRTFTSTEAQTDDTVLCCPDLTSDRERRRRERRERRQNRRANPVNPRPTGEISTQTSNGAPSLPDILDTHLPPPYTSHPNTLQRNQPPPNIHTVPGRPLPHLGLIPPPVGIPPPQILNGMVPPPGLPPNMVPHPRPRTALQNVVPNSVPHVSFPPPNVIPGQVPLVQNVADANSGFRFALPVGQFRR
ncbi:hypothetical protein HHI36_015952 [Cryptolaemus montrouzieri]|uniref:Uncharacterized protein n=1 Tax=Cryptolaemus montrouzieri TaxID=559131 RepID=A0ABD2N7B1_9CUCU